MANLIKKIKIKQSDGSFSDYIPIGVDSSNVILANNKNLETELNNLDENKLEASNIVAGDNISIQTSGNDIVISSTGGGGGGSIPIDGVSNISATAGDETATIKWTDPDNVVLEGITLAEWSGTKLVINTEHYPENTNDGVMKVDSKVKNQYQTNGYQLTGLTNDTQYYGMLFPYSTGGYVNSLSGNRFTITPGAIYPSAATNLAVAADSANLTFTLSFTMPSDAVKATAVMKKGSAPNSATDGSYVNNLISGQTATFSNIEKDTDYYFAVYTYNSQNRETKSSVITKKIASLEIVTFADGTDAQIKAMLDAHYNGEIDIADYWTVGNTRKISLNAITFADGSYNTTWNSQDVTIVITAIKQHDLATPINGITKAAITCQTREAIGMLTFDLTRARVTDNTKVHWSGIALRTFCNGDFLTTAMPTGIRNMIKPVSRTVLKTRGCSGTGSNGTVDKTTETVTDSIFLPTYPEIFGNTAYDSYMSKTTPAGEEGTQWKYYETASNRIKYGNNNGAPNSSVQYWWNGSPSTYFNRHGYYWCAVRTDGCADCYTGGDDGDSSVWFAPAFAL